MNIQTWNHGTICNCCANKIALRQTRGPLAACGLVKVFAAQ